MSEFVPVAAELTLSLEGSSVGAVANNLTTTVEGYSLDARQGYVLDQKKLDVSKVANNLDTTEEGWALDARRGKYLDEVKVGFSDIVNDLSTGGDAKALSAAQGRALDEKKLDKSQVMDNLTSTSAADALSANQGRALKALVDGKAAVKAITVTLASDSWSSLKQTVTATGVTASNHVVVAPAYASQKTYFSAGVGASAQAANKLTFTALKAPDANLTVNVLIIDG